MSSPIFFDRLAQLLDVGVAGKAQVEFHRVQSRLKLVIWPSWPNGIVWTWPFWWRSLIERSVKPSTVPLALPQSMYSPTRKASSAR